ncbi:MAG: phosphatase domain-containing protein [Sphingomonadaceae bacterium]
MPFLAAPPRLKPYFGYRNEHHLVISARALRGREADWDRRTTFAKMRRLWRAFASREVPELVMSLEARNGERIERAVATTGSEGFCHFTLTLEDGWPLPARSEWETVTLRWSAHGEPQEATGLVLAPGTDHALGIISDVDDTILETGAHDLLRNWRRVLAQMPAEREPVPGSVELYAHLGGTAAGAHFPASERPFFYVSSSPWNLFDYLVAFKKAHGLPFGPMMLRDWGFNRATLGSSSHGAHKTAAIGSILDFYPERRFALIGDSTQADAEAFAAAVAAHPGRVAGVLLRKAPGASVSPAEETALAEIEASKVPVWLGESYSLDRDFLRRLGLASDHDAQTVLDTTANEADLH